MPDLVGIVVVSHSRSLADAAVELASQMNQGGSVPIAVAAGADGGLGTDAVAIAEAIREVDGPAGLVVLMDLGSALLSAELALELVDDVRERVLLSPAPLVEGLVAAVVTAAGGGRRSEVAAEAAAGLAAKEVRLGAPSEPEPEPVAAPGVTTVRGSFVVADPHGLHARPAAALVSALRSLGAPTTLRDLTSGAGPVPGNSLTRVAALGALAGHEIEVAVEGPPSLRRTLDALLATAGTPPPPTASPPAVPAAGPLPASPGIAIGPLRRVGRASPLPAPAGPAPAGVGPAGGGAVSVGRGGGAGTGGGPAGERARLEAAVAVVREQLAGVREKVAKELGESEAGIFDAHLLLLEDPELLDPADAAIEGGKSAEEAWAGALGNAEARWAALPDEYLRARAADLAALRDQVRGALAGPRHDPGGGPKAGGDPEVGGGWVAGVVVAPDLTPAEAATLDPEQVRGVVLAYGSPTAHSVILLRARRIPAVVAAGPGVLELPAGTVLALDGTAGELAIDPEDDVREQYGQRQEREAARGRRARAAAGEPAVTVDGVRIALGANLAGADDARAAAAAGADLAGLVRTEFLFLGRDTAPDQDEQYAAYRELAAALSGRRLTLRTLDVGGDKPLPYLPLPPTDNPFLGVRGLRLSLLRPELFAGQLAAIVRIAHETPVTALFPMVSTVDELRAARAALDAAIDAVGRGAPGGLLVGAMIEVPAAALKASALAPYVDEFSVGTNDLTQYALAAARGDGGVAALGDPWDPGVLGLIDAVCRNGAGRPVAVCGEFAAAPEAAAVLVGLGVRELSVVPAAVAGVKEDVRGLDAARAAVLAHEALSAAGPAEARALFR